MIIRTMKMILLSLVLISVPTYGLAGWGWHKKDVFVKKNVVTRFVHVDALNMRKCASSKCHVLGHAYMGEQVQVLSQNGGWSKVKNSKGTRGWVASRYIKSWAPDNHPVVIQEPEPNRQPEPAPKSVNDFPTIYLNDLEEASIGNVDDSSSLIDLQSSLPMFFLHDPVDDFDFDSQIFLGETVLLVFFDNSRQAKELDTDKLNRIKNKFADSNLKVVAVALDLNEVTAIRYIAKNRPDFDLFLPAGKTDIDPGKKKNLPLYFLLNKDGNIVKKSPRKVSKDLIRAIEEEI